MGKGRFEGGFGQVQGSLEKWEGRGRGGQVSGGFKAVGRRGRGRDIRLECKVTVQVLGHGGIAKGEGGFWRRFQMDGSWGRENKLLWEEEEEIQVEEEFDFPSPLLS